jgi:hypothetical protein
MLLLLVTGMGSAQQQPPMTAPPPAAAPAVLPEALAALEKMGKFLYTLKAFALRADTSTDEVLEDSGQKIQCGGRPPALSRYASHSFSAAVHC